METTPPPPAPVHGRAASKPVVAGLLVAWVAAVAWGSQKLVGYQFRPGAEAETAATWPTTTALSLATHRSTLVMFAHPGCPCTRASLGELAEFMAQSGDRVEARVLLYEPRDAALAAAWVDDGLWTQASRIPGVSVEWDRGGDEARAFGATTSGHVVLYDTAGRLRFGGGITGSRGHAGDNAGRAALTAATSNHSSPSSGAPVFGCGIRPATRTAEARP